MNYANLITFCRIAITPFIIFSLIKNNWFLVIILFGLSIFTDFIDGYIARKFNQETILGSYLDPLADKLLITSSYLTLAFMSNNIFSMPSWFLGLTLAKEISLICGSIYLLFKFKSPIKIEPTYLAKILMGLQSFFILFLIFLLSNNITTLNWLIYLTIYTISILDIIVLIQYFLRYINL